MSTIVITGATGYIGTRLLELLLAGALPCQPAKPVEVVCITRRSPAPRPQSSPRARVRWLTHDLSGETKQAASDSDLGAVLPMSADVFVHCAAAMDFFPADEAALHRANVTSTRAAVTAAILSCARRFVYISSTEAVGPTPEDGSQASEDSESRPTSQYGKSKVECERIVREESGTLEWAILRPAGVFGPHDVFIVRQAVWGARFGLMLFAPGGGDRLISLVHVDDVCQAVALASFSKPARMRETYNIACPDAMTFKQLLRVVNESVGWRSALVPLPIPAALGTALLKAARPLLRLKFPREFMYHPQTVDRMQEDRSYSIARARRLLGYRPTYKSQEQAVREVALGIAAEEVLSPWTRLALWVPVVFAVYAFLCLLDRIERGFRTSGRL